MTVIPGDTYAERAIAGTLAGRANSSITNNTADKDQKEIYIGTSLPAEAKVPFLFIDTSTTPPTFKYDDGS